MHTPVIYKDIVNKGNIRNTAGVCQQFGDNPGVVIPNLLMASADNDDRFPLDNPGHVSLTDSGVFSLNLVTRDNKSMARPPRERALCGSRVGHNLTVDYAQH